MRITKWMMISAGVLFGLNANAGDREFADIYTECGIGALIAPRNEAVAAVTNVTWDLGTTAISSNISSEESCEGGQEKSAAFIHDAYFDLEKELAAGEGEHVATLMTILDVAENQKSTLIASLRKGLAREAAADDFADRSLFEKSQTLYQLTQASLAQAS